MALESVTALALSSRHSIADLPFNCHRLPPVQHVQQLLPTVTSLLKKRNPKRLKYSTQRLYKDDRMPMLYVEMDPLRVDTWKLEPVIKLIKDGAVGVVPTDTVYSIVCDLKSHSSIERLRRIKDIRSSKARVITDLTFLFQGVGHSFEPDDEDFSPLSILCHSLQDIDTYTMGFPRGNARGQADIFRAVKHCLPGPYTFILPASKALPKQCIRHGTTTKFVSRKNVGVRIPDDAICQAILHNLDAPLISTSVESAKDQWIIDPIIIVDTYGPEGLDFIVDGGTRIADPSTVVDMTRNPPTIIRQGKGPKQDWMVVEGEDSNA